MEGLLFILRITINTLSAIPKETAIKRINGVAVAFDKEGGRGPLIVGLRQHLPARFLSRILTQNDFIS